MMYVIGDIHGELKKLTALVKSLENGLEEYIFLGDYLDKGTDAYGTIEFLIDLSKTKKCIFLMGDHEYAWLKYLQGEKRFSEFLLNYGGIATLASYLRKDLSKEKASGLLEDQQVLKAIFKKHMAFYDGLKPYYQFNNGYICVHAGINPSKYDLPLQSHSQEEMVFIRSEFLSAKMLYQGKKVIFGHTAFREPYVDKYKIGIDTGAVYAEFGILTAFNIDTNTFIQHNGKIRSLSYEEKQNFNYSSTS